MKEAWMVSIISAPRALPGSLITAAGVGECKLDCVDSLFKRQCQIPVRVRHIRHRLLLRTGRGAEREYHL